MADYTLAQIYGALGGVDNGQQMITSLQNILAQNKVQDKSGEILAKLGLKSVDEVDNLATTLKVFQQAGNDPAAMAGQPTDLTKQVKDFQAKFEQSEAKAKAERDKRIKNTIATQLTAELTKGNAIMPEAFSQILAANVAAKDDDTLIYKSGDKEISIADGVKAWLEANPSAVKNTGQQGAGSSSGSSEDQAGGKMSVEQLGKLDMKDYIKYRTQHKE